MKDTAPFDVKEAKKDRFHEKWDIDLFIKNAAERSRENRDTPVSVYLCCFSTKQLADFCKEGYQKTQATEQKVREELMNRIEVGDKVLVAPFDVVKSYQEVTPQMLEWHTVTARNARQIRLEQGGWYSKNNILWFQMFNKAKND